MMEDMELDMALSDEQAEYFKDTDIIDDNHNPKLCYHGTKSELHNEIDEARFGSQAGSGFGPFIYCSDREDIARDYAGGTDNQVMAVYLDIRKPLNLYDCNTISFEQYAAILKKVDPKALLGKALKKDICYKEKNRSYPPKEGCGIPPRVEIDYKPPKVKPLEHLPVIGNSKAEERAVYDILYEKRDLVRDVLMLQALYEAMKEVKPDLSPLDWNHAVTDVTGYDGFIRGDTSEIGAFFPEQIKAVNNRNPQRDNGIFDDASIKSLADLKREQAERIAARQRDRENEPEREIYHERKPARPYDEYER